MTDDNMKNINLHVFLWEKRHAGEQHHVIDFPGSLHTTTRQWSSISPFTVIICQLRTEQRPVQNVRIQPVSVGENSKWRFVRSFNFAMDALRRLLLLVATTWWLVGSLIVGTAAMTNQDAYPGEFSCNIWTTCLPPTRFPSALLSSRRAILIQPLCITILSVALPSALRSSRFLVLMDEQNAN